MELVVDANILVAGFLRSAVTRELLLDERLSLYAPEFSLTESERILSSQRLHRKMGLSRSEIQQLLAHLTARTQILPERVYAPHLSGAQQVAPDPEDVPYLALALHLKLPLWSNDLALKKQHEVLVYTTGELLEVL